MSFTPHQFVGLAKPAYLPSDIKVTNEIVPARVFQVRSNQKRSAAVVTRVTRHETYNFKTGANARMHRNYLHGGPVDSTGKPVYAGYNCVSDDKEIIQLTPYDEVTWAAGNEVGNLTSDHHELCVNDGIDHTKARRISAALDAAILHARGLTPAALVQHNVWWGKNCPYLLRVNGLWSWYVNQVWQFYNAIVAFLKGDGAVVPIPDMPTTNLKSGDRVITTDALNVRQGSGTGFNVTITLPAGTAAEVINGPRTADDYTWYDVKGEFGTGWVASDWLSVLPPEETKPSPSWPYPNPVMPAWWGELQKGTHIVDGGMMWFRSNDLYKVKRDTKRLRIAGGSEEVGPVLKAGETFRDAAKGQSAIDKRAYVITDGGTRVALEDLEFVQES